jgi:hypothetical protein
MQRVVYTGTSSPSSLSPDLPFDIADQIGVDEDELTFRGSEIEAVF